MNSYNTDVTKNQQAKEKLNAVETMKRVEEELGLNAHMAYMAKIAMAWWRRNVSIVPKMVDEEKLNAKKPTKTIEHKLIFHRVVPA